MVYYNFTNGTKKEASSGCRPGAAVFAHTNTNASTTEHYITFLFIVWEALLFGSIHFENRRVSSLRLCNCLVGRHWELCLSHWKWFTNSQETQTTIYYSESNKNVLFAVATEIIPKLLYSINYLHSHRLCMSRFYLDLPSNVKCEDVVVFHFSLSCRSYGLRSDWRG